MRDLGIVKHRLERCRAERIGAVVLVGRFLDHQAAVEHGMVERVCQFRVRGVYGMRVVAAHEDRGGQRAAKIIPR